MRRALAVAGVFAAGAVVGAGVAVALAGVAFDLAMDAATGARPARRRREGPPRCLPG